MDGILRWRVLETLRSIFRISSGRMSGGKLDIAAQPIPTLHIGMGFRTVGSAKEWILCMLSWNYIPACGKAVFMKSENESEWTGIFSRWRLPSGFNFRAVK